MKQVICLFFMVCIIASFSAQGQNVSRSSASIELRRYVMDVQFIGQKRLQSGVLFDLTDSTVVLAPIQGLKPRIKALIRQQGDMLLSIDSIRRVLHLRTYRYNTIRRLTLHRRGYAGKGFLLGTGIGVALGFAQGGDDSGFIRFPASFYAVTYGVALSSVGLIIGFANIKSVNAKEQSVATKEPTRFQRFTIVEQLKQANLYTP